MAVGPIALAEVQGYVYAAKARGGDDRPPSGALDARAGNGLDSQADGLRENFEAAFWCEEIGTYALALDGEKRPCRVRASNAGHLLLTGIASPEHGRRCRRSADVGRVLHRLGHPHPGGRARRATTR